jgi:small-conductance mechanosensitive channel
VRIDALESRNGFAFWRPSYFIDSVTASPILLIATVILLTGTRARGLMTHITVETLLLLAIGAFLVWQGTSPLPINATTQVGFVGSWARALAVVWWLIGARLVVNITVLARGRDPKSREAKLFSDLAAAVIYVTTILIILNSVLNLNVRGLLVTSGVIAIALGLALQSTLADVFSGIAVSLEHPFHLGDRVSLGDSVEGVIVQVNWRSIRIRTDEDDLATIPNSVVAKAQIINRSVPTRRRAAAVEIMAPSVVAAETVIELVRQASLLCPALLAAPAPSFTLRRFGPRSSTYGASFYVSDTSELVVTKSLLLRHTARLFRHAGIGGSGLMPSIDLLASLAIFEALSRENLETLSKDLILHAVEPGEFLFAEGAIATSFYIIEAGVMETSRQEALSLNHSPARLGAGDYIGELGLITGSPRACTLTALTHGRVQELSGESLTRLLKSNVALNAAMERSVRKGLALLDRQDAAAAVHPTERADDLFDRIKRFFHV